MADSDEGVIDLFLNYSRGVLRVDGLGANASGRAVSRGWCHGKHLELEYAKRLMWSEVFVGGVGGLARLATSAATTRMRVLILANGSKTNPCSLSIRHCHISNQFPRLPFAIACPSFFRVSAAYIKSLGR